MTATLPIVHVYGSFLLIAQNIFKMGLVLAKIFIAKRDLDFEEKKFLKFWILGFGLIISLAAPWYLHYISNLHEFYGGIQWIEKQKVVTFYRFFQECISVWSSYLLSIILTLILVAYSHLVYRRYKAKERFQAIDWFFNSPINIITTWVIVSVGFPLLIGEIWRPILVFRYLNPVSYGLLILILAPFEILLKKSNILFVIAVFILARHTYVRAEDYFKSEKKEEWQAALGKIAAHEGTQELVLFKMNFGDNSPILYYSRKLGISDRLHVHIVTETQALAEYVENSKGLWIATRPRFKDELTRFKTNESGGEQNFYEIYLLKTYKLDK